MQDYQMTGLFSELLAKIRRKKVLKYLNNKRNLNILDIGCGQAKIIELLNDTNKYIGADINRDIISLDKKKYPKAQFYLLDITSQIFNTGNCYNIILMLAVLEHFNDAAKVLSRLHKLLCPEGKILITTPHPMAKYILKIGTQFNLFNREAEEEHKHYYSKDDLKELAESAGFIMIHYSTFLFGLNQFAVFTHKR